MDRLNLIHLYTFYLAAMFLVSTVRRFQQYQDIAQIVFAAPGRWPRVLQQIKKHWIVFMTWTTLRPAGVAITLLLTQSVCSRLIWPQAAITLADFWAEWWMLIPVGAAGVAMLGVDGYFVLCVGTINPEETGRYLDEAEHWLKSWKAPLISTLTLGYLNPRVMVDTGVKKAMEDGKGLLQSALWWMSLQSGLRTFFGLLLWLSWAVHPVLEN
ncbi:hypothetical protein [Zavarzinella formosa]|uniref:hypothetical protein n=1 Tax=Zavarzinella formosa TaxID=360055 RepID=UPI0002E85C86|nr:hypothetical protein [Zavarzinella formosa]